MSPFDPGIILEKIGGDKLLVLPLAPNYHQTGTMTTWGHAASLCPDTQPHF